MKKAYSSFILMLLLWCPFNSYAEGTSRMDSANLFDNLLERFHVASSMWGKVLIGYGTWLFWSLALISMVWTFGMMALRKADPQEFFAEFVQFLVTTGFFFWLLLNGPEIASSIIDSLRQLAANASGLEWHVTPSSIVDIGFGIVGKAIDNSSVWSVPSSIVGLLVAAVILMALTLVAVNMLIILITGWILVYGGVVVLGFGGGRWTQDIAINYYRTVVGIGLQAFSMLLIVGIGHSFLDQYYAMMASDILLKEMFIMLVVALMLLVFIDKIPPIIGGLVHGGGFGGGGGGSGGGASLGVGGAMGAAGLAATAAGAAYAQMGGGVQALSAAFKAAQQTVGENSGGGASGSSGGALSSLSQAMGGAGQFAGSFGSHLASGAVNAVKDKMSGAHSAMSEKASNTLGGKVADKINQSMSGDDSIESTESSSTSSQDTESNNGSNAQSNVELMQVSSGDIQTQNSETSGSFDEVRAFVNQETSDTQEQFQ